MSLRKNFGISIFACACAAVCAIPLAAQTTTPATCTTAPTGVNNLSIERVLELSNVLTTITPNVPANVLASITSGAQEVRSRIVYNPTLNTVTETTFLVAAGSPNPTPLGVDVTPGQLQSYTLSVDKVYTSCKPTPSIMFVGTVLSTNGPFGNYSGAPGAISLGYTTDNPPQFNNVVELLAGAVVGYSKSANGSVSFPAAAVTPPGTASGAPMIVLSPVVPPTGGSIQVFFNPFAVSASASTDPNNLPLTFMWVSDKPASFNPNPTAANPIVTFQSGAGDYKITVTVTNSAGISSSQSFVLTYISK